MSGPVHERCILCVDDDQEFLKSLEFFLPEQINRHRTDELSYRFAFLSNPVEALEVLAELVACGETVAMVISDQQMPHMKGTEFLAQARELAPSSVRILLTGHSGIEAAITAINDQLLDRYLTKPIESEHDFMLSVKHLLDRFEMTARLRDQERLIRELYDFANTLNATADVDSTLRIMADFTRSAIGCEEIQVVLRPVAMPAAEAPAPVDEPLEGPRDRHSIEAGIVARVEDCPGYESMASPSAQIWPAGRVAFAVLGSHDHVIGLLLAWESRNAAPFTEEVLDKLRYIAAGASIALENQRRRQQLEEIARTRARHLEEARVRLGILDQLKNDFLTFVSHEIRTPLNHMSAIGLLEDEMSEIEQKQMVEIIRSGYERFERFMLSSLEYFEWFSAKAESSDEVTDLAELARTMSAALEARSNARVVVSIRAGDPCMVHFPRHCSETLLGILLDNAVKFSLGPASIQLDLAADAERVTLTMSDQGRGFPPEWATEIFRPFTIADSSHHGQGSALSLAKVAAMVQAYGGHIRAQSPGVNQGCTFTVELPVKVDERTRVLEFGPHAKGSDESDSDPESDYPFSKAA